MMGRTFCILEDYREVEFVRGNAVTDYRVAPKRLGSNFDSDIGPWCLVLPVVSAAIFRVRRLGKHTDSRNAKGRPESDVKLQSR